MKYPVTILDEIPASRNEIIWFISVPPGECYDSLKCTASPQPFQVVRCDYAKKILYYF